MTVPLSPTAHVASSIGPHGTVHAGTYPNVARCGVCDSSTTMRASRSAAVRSDRGAYLSWPSIRHRQRRGRGAAAGGVDQPCRGWWRPAGGLDRRPKAQPEIERTLDCPRHEVGEAQPCAACADAHSRDIGARFPAACRADRWSAWARRVEVGDVEGRSVHADPLTLAGFEGAEHAVAARISAESPLHREVPGQCCRDRRRGCKPERSGAIEIGPRGRLRIPCQPQRVIARCWLAAGVHHRIEPNCDRKIEVDQRCLLEKPGAEHQPRIAPNLPPERALPTRAFGRAERMMGSVRTDAHGTVGDSCAGCGHIGGADRRSDNNCRRDEES